MEFELKNAASANVRIEELLNVLTMDAQYDSEKIGLERQRLRKDPKSEEALRLLEGATELKRKQQFLRENMQMKLRLQLEELFRDEDSYMDRLVAFNGDEQGLPRHKLPSISAVIKEQPKVRKHLEMDKWMDLYKSQPWLAKQTAEEARNKEQRDAKGAEIAKVEAILDKQREELDDSERRCKSINDQLDDLRAQLDDEETSQDERYRIRQQMAVKTEELEQKREDQARREEVFNKRESELKVLQDELSGEEAEAQERMAKQKDAKASFEKRESENEADQASEMKDRMKQLADEKDKIRKQLDKLSLPESATTSDALTTFSPEEQQRVAQLRERQEAIAKETQEWEAVEQELKARRRACQAHCATPPRRAPYRIFAPRRKKRSGAKNFQNWPSRRLSRRRRRTNAKSFSSSCESRRRTWLRRTERSGRQKRRPKRSARRKRMPQKRSSKSRSRPKTPSNRWGWAWIRSS